MNKKRYLYFIILIGIITGIFLYSVYIQVFVDSYLTDYSDLGRIPEVFEHYQKIQDEQAVLFLSSSGFIYGIDQSVFASVTNRSVYNVGLGGSSPLTRVSELSAIKKAKPHTVIIGVTPGSFSDAWPVSDDQIFMANSHVILNAHEQKLLGNQSHLLSTNPLTTNIYKRKFMLSSILVRLAKYSPLTDPIDFSAYNLDFIQPSNNLPIKQLSHEQMVARVESDETKREFAFSENRNKQKQAFEYILSQLINTDINVIVVSTPMNPLLVDKVINLDGFYAYLQQISMRYNVFILDYSQTYRENYFADGRLHMNDQGMQGFSRDLVKSIQQVIQ
jgi:hypothetical protein